MTGLLRRLGNFFIEEDEAANELGGGRVHETISGTIGRAQQSGRPWAGPVAAVVDGVAKLFSGKPDHCLRVAAAEAARRAALATINPAP
jgi:hypothetical protein